MNASDFNDPGKVCQSHDLVYRTCTDDPRYYFIVTGTSPAAPAPAMAPSDLLRKTLIPFWWNCFPVQDLELQYPGCSMNQVYVGNGLKLLSMS